MKNILFNTEMTKAILDGRKVQFREIFNISPYYDRLIQLDTDTVDVRDYDGSGLDTYDLVHKIGEIVYVQKYLWKDQRHNERIVSVEENDENPIYLTITNIKIERLKDITICEIKKEGIEFDEQSFASDIRTDEEFDAAIRDEYYEKWIGIWDSSKPQGWLWEDNPYVFVYEFEFERVEGCN